MKKIEIALLITLLITSLVPSNAYGEMANPKYKVELSSYLELAQGRDVKPKVTLFYCTNPRGEYEEIAADDYKVTYFKILSNKGEFPQVREEVKKISKMGEYMVVATSKVDETKHGSALFTVVGRRQKIRIKKTKYTFKKKGKSMTLRPRTNGDGEGFIFETSDPKVATVSKKGKVRLRGKGRTIITVETVGDERYEKGRLKVYIEVKTNKKNIKKSVGKNHRFLKSIFSKS